MEVSRSIEINWQHLVTVFFFFLPMNPRYNCNINARFVK